MTGNRPGCRTSSSTPFHDPCDRRKRDNAKRSRTGLMALVEQPDQIAALRADPGLLPGAADEMIRWASPVLMFDAPPPVTWCWAMS